MNFAGAGVPTIAVDGTCRLTLTFFFKSETKNSIYFMIIAISIFFVIVVRGLLYELFVMIFFLWVTLQ